MSHNRHVIMNFDKGGVNQSDTLALGERIKISKLQETKSKRPKKLRGVFCTLI